MSFVTDSVSCDDGVLVAVFSCPPGLALEGGSCSALALRRFSTSQPSFWLARVLTTTCREESNERKAS